MNKHYSIRDYETQTQTHESQNYRQHYPKKQHNKLTATQILKPMAAAGGGGVLDFYENTSIQNSVALPTPVGGGGNNMKKYSYNSRDRESYSGNSNGTNTEERPSRVNSTNNRYGAVISHQYNDDSKRSTPISPITMTDNTFLQQVDYTNANGSVGKHRTKNGNNTAVIKSIPIMVRPLNTIESVEDFTAADDEAKPLPLAKANMMITSKSNHRKSQSFKDTPAIDNEEAIRALAAKNAKRSTSVQMDKNEAAAERKRMFKNKTALGHQSSDSASSDESDEEDYEESVDIFTHKKPTTTGKGARAISNIEEDDEEIEDDSAAKIFPAHNPNSKQTNNQTSMKLLKEMFYLLKNKSNTIDFIMRKAPQCEGAIVQTRIKRTKRRLVTQYTMFLELPDGSEIALMQTRRKRASTRVYICINALELVEKRTDEQNEIERYLQIPVGKLKSKNKFKVIYDKFLLTNNGKKTSLSIKAPSFFSRKSKKIQIDEQTLAATGAAASSCKTEEAYKEFLSIEYENSIFKISQPLRFSACLHNLKGNSSSNKANKFLDFDTKLVTKGPKFDKEKQKYVLDFNKRVQVASVNNFQVISSNPDHEDNIILQVGKIKNNEYICDYAYPLSAFEAFAMVLSAFNRKMV